MRESLRKLRTDYIDVLYVHWYVLVMNLLERCRMFCGRGDAPSTRISDGKAGTLHSRLRYASMGSG